jgi:hypothetical protein
MQIGQQTPAHPGWQRPQADQHYDASGSTHAPGSSHAARPTPGHARTLGRGHACVQSLARVLALATHRWHITNRPLVVATLLGGRVASLRRTLPPILLPLLLLPARFPPAGHRCERLAPMVLARSPPVSIAAAEHRRACLIVLAFSRRAPAWSTPAQGCHHAARRLDRRRRPSGQRRDGHVQQGGRGRRAWLRLLRRAAAAYHRLLLRSCRPWTLKRGCGSPAAGRASSAAPIARARWNRARVPDASARTPTHTRGRRL